MHQIKLVRQGGEDHLEESLHDFETVPRMGELVVIDSRIWSVVGVLYAQDKHYSPTRMIRSAEFDTVVYIQLAEEQGVAN